MVRGYIEYCDEGISDNYLRDYICGIVPMGEEVWCWCRTLDMLQCCVGIVFTRWCRMCVMHLRSKQYYKVVCIGKMNECRRLVRHYAHERTIGMGFAEH